mgnify:CR=1 FL=1
MTKLTSRRWAIIFFISLALNVFLGGLFVADKYFKDNRSRGFRGMTYSVPWARRILGDEVRPMAREIFRENRESFRGTRKPAPGFIKTSPALWPKSRSIKMNLPKRLPPYRKIFKLVRAVCTI